MRRGASLDQQTKGWHEGPRMGRFCTGWMQCAFRPCRLHAPDAALAGCLPSSPSSPSFSCHCPSTPSQLLQPAAHLLVPRGPGALAAARDGAAVLCWQQPLPCLLAPWPTLGWEEPNRAGCTAWAPPCWLQVRFCTEQYEPPGPGNLGNAYAHLTNYAVNKTNPAFVFNE